MCPVVPASVPSPPIRTVTVWYWLQFPRVKDTNLPCAVGGKVNDRGRTRAEGERRMETVGSIDTSPTGRVASRSR